MSLQEQFKPVLLSLSFGGLYFDNFKKAAARSSSPVPQPKPSTSQSVQMTTTADTSRSQKTANREPSKQAWRTKILRLFTVKNYCLLVVFILWFDFFRYIPSFWVGVDFVPELTVDRVNKCGWYLQCAMNGTIFFLACRDPEQLHEFFSLWATAENQLARLASSFQSEGQNQPARPHRSKASPRCYFSKRMAQNKRKHFHSRTNSVEASPKGSESVLSQSSRLDGSRFCPNPGQTSSIVRNFKTVIYRNVIVSWCWVMANAIFIMVMMFANINDSHVGKLAVIITNPFPPTLFFEMFFGTLCTILASCVWILPVAFICSLCSALQCHFSQLEQIVKQSCGYSSTLTLPEEDNSVKATPEEIYMYEKPSKEQLNPASLEVTSLEFSNEGNSNAEERVGSTDDRTDSDLDDVEQRNADNKINVHGFLNTASTSDSTRTAFTGSGSTRLKNNSIKKKSRPTQVRSLAKVHAISQKTGKKTLGQKFLIGKERPPKPLATGSRAFPHNIEDMRRLHLQLCACVRVLDRTFSRLLMSSYVTHIPLICFIVYEFVRVKNLGVFHDLAMVFWCVGNFACIMSASVACARVHEAVKCFGE